MLKTPFAVPGLVPALLALVLSGCELAASFDRDKIQPARPVVPSIPDDAAVASDAGMNDAGSDPGAMDGGSGDGGAGDGGPNDAGTDAGLLDGALGPAMDAALPVDAGVDAAVDAAVDAGEGGLPDASGDGPDSATTSAGG